MYIHQQPTQVLLMEKRIIRNTHLTGGITITIPPLVSTITVSLFSHTEKKIMITKLMVILALVMCLMVLHPYSGVD